MLKLIGLALFVLTLLPMAGIAETPSASTAQAEIDNEHHEQVAAIEQVMKQYHEAVVSHNGAALSALFLPDANLWLSVLTDRAYEGAQAKGAKDPKVKVGSYRDFAKVVSSTPKTFDPEHSNVVIHTDGTIAAVYFDFVFNIDGKVENRGSETWQLVNTANGWRIAAITYSSDPAALQ
ncbi:MAG: nuclear transport factor 2 family protein [Acidobacteriaceae bacterium]